MCFPQPLAFAAVASCASLRAQFSLCHLNTPALGQAPDNRVLSAQRVSQHTGAVHTNPTFSGISANEYADITGMDEHKRNAAKVRGNDPVDEHVYETPQHETSETYDWVAAWGDEDSRRMRPHQQQPIAAHACDEGQYDIAPAQPPPALHLRDEEQYDFSAS